ncbi:NADPH-dependent FMN reductase [Haloarchaeobius amylolyticus]|uniref:NADPH-dependent FMN reductase n=1 Tax=Haloarchaeobius amylolyticus TaxID=1198296 RepID=UPI00226EAE6F|nr:NADPH-dependent FMN reductase [Haloarchaeobius amylolyticus]
MSGAPTVLAVSGSLREESYTRTALVHALAAAAAAGAETDLLDLREADVPMFDPDEDDQGVTEHVRRVREADAVILGSPVYHGSYSGALKNFHDFCSFDEYEDTVVGLLATAGGGSYGPTLEHMRSTVRGVHGHVVPEQVGIRGAYDKFEAAPDAPGGRVFTDEDIEERVAALGEAVVAAARRFDARCQDDGHAVADD